MGAKIIREHENKLCKFEDLEVGDWFEYENCYHETILCLKVKNSEFNNYIVVKDNNVLIYTLDNSDEVRKVNVEIRVLN